VHHAPCDARFTLLGGPPNTRVSRSDAILAISGWKRKILAE
jgi:hypothetical protein